MNNKKILTLSILVFLFVSSVTPISLLTILKNLAKSNYVPAVITSVSTSQTDQNDSLRRGSLLGGNTLFIQGLGLTTRLSDIEIIIGDNLECPVNLALSSAFQTACTVPAGDAGSYSITVLINGYEAYCPSSICYYVYDTSYTPVFQHIVPNAITANKGIKIGGLARASQSSSLIANFDQYSCIFGYYGDQDLAPNSLSFSKCQIGTLPVGYYTASFASSCQGRSFKMKSISLIADLIFNAFDLIVVPEITGLSSNSGSSSVAEILTITGTGFSNKVSENVVYFEGKSCGVVSSNYNQIKCSLSDFPTVQPRGVWRPGHCGLYQKTFGLQKLAALKLTSAFLRYTGLFNRLVSFEIPYNNGGGEFTGALETFFKAPVSGDYQFYLSAQGPAELYISSTPLSKDNLTKIAELVSGTEFRNFFNPGESNQISNPIRLEAGEFYFMQALHMAQGAEHLTVGVRVPTNQKYSMSMGEVISIKIQADVQRLETILTLANSADLLQFLYVSGNKILRSRYFAFSSPSDIIVNALADVGIEAVVLSQILLNSNGKAISSGNAAKVQYKLRFYTASSLSSLPGLNKANSGTLLKATDVTPTALVSGSFKLAFANKVISLNFDSTSDDVEDAFNAAFSSRFSFKAYRYGRPEEGAQWIVYFDRNLGNIPTGRVQSSSLKGGKSGVSVGLTVLQDGNSNNVLLAPITPSLLYTPEEVSQISVSVSGIRAVCSGNCTYTYTPTVPAVPTITNFKWSGSSITINLTNSGVTNASLFDELSFGGSLLTLKSYVSSTGTISCSIPTNPDGTAMIAAGIWSPIVHILNVGYVKSSASVIKIQIKPTIGSITTQQIATGFLQFTIVGTGFGFGLSSSDSFGTSVGIGGVSCTLTYLSNIKITCNAQLAVTDGPVNVTVNNVTASAPFVKTQPPISLDVSGDCYLDLYGTFTNDTVVSLVNNATGAVESCRTCERDNTFIRCSTCGLSPGNYTALTTTFTAPNTLKQSSVPFDIPFYVYSISPQSGSQLGGSLLTITGKGFSSTVNENQVSIGSLQCKVISSSATQLQCITTPNTAALTGPQDVFAYVKLEFTSTCLGNCSFTYSSDSTPQITQASSTYLKSEDQVTLTGKLFSSTTQVFLDGLAASIVSMTSTQLIFKVPGVQANTKVNFTVTDPAYGNYYVDSSSLVFSSAFILQDVNPKSGSKGGAVLTLTGFGFSSASAQVSIGGATCQILQVSATQIICKAPANSQGAVSVSQTNFSAVTCNGCSYQYDINLTPTVTSLTVQDTIDALNITLQGTLLNVASPVTVSLVNNDVTQPLEIAQTTSGLLVATLCGTISGTYNLDVRVGNNLVLYQNVPSQVVNVTFTQASIPTSNQVISQAGGNPLVLNLDQGYLPSNPSLVAVKIAGFDCPIEFATRGRISCIIPPLRLPNLRQLATEEFLSGNWIVENANDQPALTFDDNTASSFKGTDNNCFVGIDVGQGLVAEVSQVQFFPRIGMDLSQLYGSVIEGSNDGQAWTVFSTISSSVYEGYNTITFAAGSRPLYRYLRWRQASAISKCELAELKFKGTLFSSLSVTNTAIVSVPNVQVTINGLTKDFVANLQYRQDITPTVTGVSPAVGSSIGGTVITITGTGFGTDKTGVEVYLDDIECNVTSVQNTAIVCTTGALPDVSLRTGTPKGIVNVYVGDNGLAMNTNVRFLYAERWSDVKTWGCGGLPIEGDSVEVPVGMNLLVDMSPPKLVAVVVEGGLIFEDKNINFGCEYIMVRNGFVRIGTEAAPIQSNITLTLYGDRDDEQLPIFGNKVLGMYEGVIDIHGAERTVLNTFLASTAVAGSSVITVVSAGDWKAGETIVISSTSLDASQNEKMTIASVSGNTITLTSALAYTHLGESKTVGGNSVGVNAVVSLLNRNIVIKGDDSSLESNYGAHLLFYDPGTQNTLVRISNAEFVNGGQAGFVERYPINFQNAGDQMDSYVSKCSIHSSYNKGLQVKGTQYLQVLNNTFYDIENEAIILTDGVEINNIIQDNVIVQISSSLFVYNSASTSPAISLSNPLNFIRRNIIAGVANNAFTLEFNTNSQGGSYSTSICPQGERLGAFEDNYVLACGGVALFIDNYFPRTFPCGAYRSNNNQDPFSLNEPVTATFKNFIAARAGVAVQGLNLGAVVFDGFRIYDSKTGAIEVRHARNAQINSTQVTNTFIVGSLGLSDALSISNAWGILTPSDDGFTLKSATFANFDASSVALQGCSNCGNAGETTGSKTTFLQSLVFTNVAKRVAFTAPYYSHIFRDLDGTLTGLANGGTVVYNFPHLQVPECSLNTAVYSGLVCTSAIELREINFWAVNPEELQQDQTLFISRLQQGASLSSFSNLSYHYPQAGFSAPFATGYPYQVFFSNLLDWTNLTLKISPLYTSKDLPITLTFNYTEPREDFDVIRTVFLQADVNVTNTTQMFDRFTKAGVSSYSFGDFYNDVTNKALYLTVTGNNVGQPILDENDAAQALVIAYQCKLYCPAPIVSQFPSVTRKWSQAEAWPSGKIPVAGENVTIPITDLVVLDMDTAALGNLEIQGQLLFADNQDSITLTANQIWVRGSMTAGTMDTPYSNQAVIRLTGAVTDTPFVVNFAVDVGPRALVVTGFLSFVGQPVNGVARLGANGNIGDNKILISGDISPFKIGDEVAIAPSGSNANEYETKTITDINYDTMILTLDSGLQYFHYGSDSVYMGSDGMTMVDMRAEVVPMSRNVRIEALNDGLGAVILTTQEYNSDTTITGRIDIENALISNCGQTGTDRAAITFELAASDQGSVLSGNVIYNSLSYGIRFTKTTSVNAMNNVIFKAQHIGILFEDNNQLIMVINNLIFGITPNARGSAFELSDFSAGIYLIDSSNANSVIAQNTVAGCSFSCYFILAPSCSIDNFFVQNIAHSGRFGYIAYGDQESCVSISGFTAYRTTYGVISYYRIDQIQASSLVLIDNTVSLNLASSSSADVRKISVTDSYFAGIALLNCPQCYTDTQCSNQAAIGLNYFTTDIWPDVYSSYTTSRDSVLGSSYDFERNYFENFQDGLFASSPQCKGNNVFKTSQYATDYIPFVTVSSSTTKYVDSNSIVKFVAATGNDQNCGSGVPCTLVKNSLIKDLDGSLTQTPNPGSLLPLISEGAKASVCTSQTATSICKSSAYALLGFKNLDTDKSQINLDPVYVANSSGFNNTVYSHRDNDPLESGDTQKYISIVQSNSSYNVSFSNDIPIELDFELQGQDSDYSILTIQYNTSKSIKVVNAITGESINPFITMPTSSPQILPSHPCGAYIFSRNQDYVQFKVTGESTCKLLVQQANSLIANIRYDIAVDDFFSAGGIAPFIDKLAAVLNIPSIRIRVVEIYQGSTGIIVSIDSETQGVGSKPQASSELVDLSNNLEQAVSSGSLNMYNAPVLSFSQKTVLAESNHKMQVSFMGTYKFYLVVIGAPVIVACIGGFLIYKYKVKGKKKPAMKIKPRKISTKTLDLPDALSATSSLQANSGFKSDDNTPKNSLIEKTTPVSRDQKRRSQMLRLGGSMADANKNLMSNAGSIGSIGALEEVAKLTKKAQSPSKDETPFATTRTMVPLMEVIPENPLTTTRRMSIDNDVEFETVNE